MILKDNSKVFRLVSAIYVCDIKKLNNSNIQIFFCQLRPNANMKNFVKQTIQFVFFLAFQRWFCQSHNPPLSASLEVWRRLYRDLFLLFSLIMFIYNKYRWSIHKRNDWLPFSVQLIHDQFYWKLDVYVCLHVCMI